MKTSAQTILVENGDRNDPKASVGRSSLWAKSRRSTALNKRSSCRARSIV